MARILFTFVGGRGHLDPLLPIARAAEDVGHTVAIAGRPQWVPDVEAFGFTAFATGHDAYASTGRIPLRPLDPSREDRDLREGFARRIARERAAAILKLCEEWHPDVLVCDEADFGGLLATECLGISRATVLVTAAGSFVRPAVVGEPLQELRVELGLPLDPELEMLTRDLVLSPCPPSFRDPAFPLPETAHSIRPGALDLAQDSTAPPWLADLSGAPTVYITLGTIFNLESGDLFERMIAGLHGSPVDVVMTVGRQIDPGSFGPLPANVRVEQYIPQSQILPHCDLVVCHGGSGSVIAALARGIPMVVIPMGADQPLNAARCEALGVGRTLDAVSATPDDVRSAIMAVLKEPAYRRAAEATRDEIAALPDVTHAVRLLELLAKGSGHRRSRPGR